jgi:NB-ARC domain
MGGIGKTELALQYALAQKGEYPAGLCWLGARDQEIATQIVTFAQAHLGLTPPDQLEIEAQVRFCWQQWPEGDALVVLDDVTDYKAIEPYLPPSDPRFKLLITTRLQLGSSVKDFPVEELDEDGAIDLLKSLVKDGRIQVQLKEARALCRWVENLPLALELLGRFLARKPDWTITRLLRALDDKRLDAKALVSNESGMTRQLGVAAVLELSWQELNEAEQELAYVLGMFAISPIPWTLIQSFLPDIESDELDDIRDEGLVDRSLLKRIGEETYQLHQIVREYFTKKTLTLGKVNYIQKKLAKAIQIIATTDLALAVKMLETIRIFDRLEDEDCLSPLEYGYYLREGYKTWTKGLGDVSKLISPFWQYPNLAQIRIRYFEENIPDEDKLTYPVKFKSIAKISIFWYCANLFPDDVSLYDEESNAPESIENKTFGYCIFSNPNFQVLSLYRDAYEDIAQKLSYIFKDGRILINESIISEENAWKSAYKLVQANDTNLCSISISKSILISKIDDLISTSQNDRPVHIGIINDELFNQLICRLNELKKAGKLEISYPWAENHFLEPPSSALIHVSKVFYSALESYQLLTKKWFPNLLDSLYTFQLMPVSIKGSIVVGSVQTQKSFAVSDSGGEIILDSHLSYFVNWFFDVLPSGSKNQVNLDLGTKLISLDDASYRETKENKIPATRPMIAHHPYSIYTQSLSNFYKVCPVSALVYSWLWHDLANIKFVKGTYHDSCFLHNL